MRLMKPVTVVAALGLAMALGACGSDQEEAPQASPTGDASATQAPVTVPQGSGEDDEEGGGGEASASPTEGQEDAEEETATEESTPADQPEEVSGAQVQGPATITGVSVHLPGEGVDACQILDGMVSCFFESQTVAPQCSGDTPLAMVTFNGQAVEVGCSPIGEAGLAPTLEAGDVLGDPTGSYLCESAQGAGVGVTCTHQGTGVTALLSSTAANVQG